MPSLSQAASVAKKASQVNKVISFSKFRYGHDPSHYPLKALPYVVTHRDLWKTVLQVACVGIICALVCLILLVVFALKPQAMAFGGGKWWSWMLAVLAVLLEAALAAAIIMAVTQSKCQTEVFVMTMRLEGKWRDGEMSKQSLWKDFQFLKKNFIVRVITYPLCLVPFVGTALWSAINATFIGWDCMDRYFDAIHMSSKLQRLEVLGEDRSDCSSLFSPSTYDDHNDYARFGFVAAFLETLPVIGSVVFPLTNACAAALFACDIEAAGGPSSLTRMKGVEEDSKAQSSTSAYGSTGSK